MPFAAVITMPATPGNKIKLEEFLRFLRSEGTKGESKLLWECPISKQLVGLRAEKHDDKHFPLSLEVMVPKIPSLPFFCHALTPDDVKELISVCKVELDTKWEGKHVTFYS